MKQRFSSLDVKVIAHELQEHLVSLRLSNVYDLSSKILLLKFSKPDNKKQLVIDTGFRCHLTEFARTTAAAPSAFVARLRKVLKTRRLTAVSQVGTDRVLEFQFSDGQYRLFLEFFASGNIILTDADLKILTLARIVTEGESQEPQRVGLEYSLENRQNFAGIPPLTKERVHDALKTAVAKAAMAPASSKKLKGKPGGDLRKALAVSITELPPILVDHALQKNQFDTTTKPEEILASESLLDDLVKSLAEARETVENITSSAVCPGYIFAKRNAPKPDSTEEGDSQNKREGILYEDFHPFIPHKLEKDPTVEVLEFTTYNETVDEFFSSIEGQKLEARLTEREVAAKRKLDAAKQEQSKRIEGLQEAQTVNFQKAAAIEANVERVQEAMDAVNGLLNQGMDWIDIGKLVEREKKRNNPVADIIKLPLNLSENIVTLQLAEEEVVDDEEDDPYETDDDASESGDESASTKAKSAGKELAVEINLTLTPWANAREYYDQRKTAVGKEEKTQQQVAKALKNTEQKINEDLKKGLKQEKALLQPIRKPLWFEKFIWFISSDGYLVIGGKDAQQNEIVYKRYLRKGDVYCHADLHGAASVIIKNNPKTPDAPIPPATLSQAGSIAVCSSDAWDSKAGMSAWWVNADQVTKSAPTGEFLPIGSFMVRGKKNFLPPAQLLLGLGVMFKISEESMAKHVKHRLYDSDIAAGNEAARPAPSSKDLDKDQTAEIEQPDTTERDEASDYESEDEQQHEEKPRDNPLQGFGGGDHDIDVQEVEDGISELKVDEKSASEEVPTQEEDDKSDEEESEDHEPVGSPAEALEAPSKSSAQTSGTATPTPGKKPAKRGQRGKAKKIAAKYRNQDEDDRAAAEALIGAAAGREKAEAEAQAKLDREAELAAAKERRRAQHQRQQKEAAEHEEARRVMMDEGLDLLDADEVDQVTALDALVGMPLPGDEILEIIPMCAPWNALGRFKYKAKLQPGTVKKGKAVKEVLERWKAATTRKGVVDETARDSERMWPREVELLKTLKPEETYNCVPVSKVKVMMSGGTGGGGSGGSGKKSGGSKGQGKGGRGGKGSKRS
ncbi:fibronectin-binding protein A N-terminus-domain-containing protein [Dactylonectria estremocensis]|uniref:Ribosome quality control complex subunit 2 n=1 Tax=Dactylonectria estremocensis TaxID=1079267 RepID=A0A9P9J9M4_9HYPO|nr:fibronectin-binding protein A N-terminus-domain-containing protein [Dactylonectria estremocensis]